MLTSTQIWIIVAVAVVLVLVILVAGLLSRRNRKIDLRRSDAVEAPARPHKSTYQASTDISFAAGPATAEPTAARRPETDGEPGVGEDAAVPRDSARPGVVDVDLPDVAVGSAGSGATAVGPGDQTAVVDETGLTGPTADEVLAGDAGNLVPGPRTEAAPGIATPPPDTDTAGTTAPPPDAGPDTEEIAPPEGRLERLRGKLAGSRSAFGQSLLGLLGAGDLDEESWEDVEATLLKADLGATMTTEIMDSLRTGMAAAGVRNAEQAREVLRSVLITALGPDMDRSVRALPHGVNGERRPGVVLVAGVNGTGKTTTTGKLARVLVASGRTVVLGAADTFRAAAADQLATWGRRVGAEVVRGREGADPAAVAFDAVKRGSADGADTVLVDTAGRLHTKSGLMDELGKVKRVVEKQTVVDEVLLVLDATTGQNGVVQARVFGEVVNVTGIVLTKLDGTAKGGIVFRVQRELGVPVKLVGLGEGPDDLAPFEPAAFVDALLD